MGAAVFSPAGPWFFVRPALHYLKTIKDRVKMTRRSCPQDAVQSARAESEKKHQRSDPRARLHTALRSGNQCAAILTNLRCSLQPELCWSDCGQTVVRLCHRNAHVDSACEFVTDSLFSAGRARRHRIHKCPASRRRSRAEALVMLGNAQNPGQESSSPS